MRISRLAILTAVLLGGCYDNGAYTLYRGSVMMDARIHVATFNADESPEYNRTNCRIAADLFKTQGGVVVDYWCEAGNYEP